MKMEGNNVLPISVDCGFEVLSNLTKDENGFRESHRTEICDVRKGDTLMLESVMYDTKYAFTVLLFKVYIDDTLRPYHMWPELTVRELNILIVKEWIRRF